MPESSNSILYFCAALVLLLFGHLMRAVRWSFLLGRNRRQNLRAGFAALSVGYLINAAVPFRIGELVRALFFAMQTKSRLTDALASIIVERAYDLLAIILLAGLFLVPQLLTPSQAVALALSGAIIALVVFAVIFAMARHAGARRALWHMASIFNERIRFVILDTALALVEINDGVKKYRGRFLLQSLVMWALYLASYAALVRAIDLNYATIIEVLFGDVFQPLFFVAAGKGLQTSLWLAVYAVTPCLLVLIYTRFRQMFSLNASAALGWLTDPLLQLNRRATDRFGEISQYDAFLCRHFSGDESLALDFETHAIQNAAIMRRLGGGSEAITAVVQVGNEMRIRKYAIDEAGRKLRDQFDWLEQNRAGFPAVTVTPGEKLENRFYYDMPYSITARDFYDFIHMNTVERSWEILSGVLACTRKLHAGTAGAAADDDAVRAYIARKVVGNFAVIRNFMPQLFENGAITVNGQSIDRARVLRFATEEFLLPRITLRGTATIHGDLTIENIISDSAAPRGWFAIDPNGGNLVESPLLDYAKLFQSLHLGYEPLNRNNPCGYSEAGIEFFMPRTIFYEELFRKTRGWVLDNLGEKAWREIRLHEIVHYFRLVPYKIRKASHTGLLFTGCLCLLIDRYFEEFEHAAGDAG